MTASTFVALAILVAVPALAVEGQAECLARFK
jgi:hypothetical protein